MKVIQVPWGAVATLSGEVLSRLALSVFQFMVANQLGAAGYGTLGLVLSYASILLPIADLGLNGLALRHMANNADPTSFRKPFALKLATSLLYLVILGFAPFFKVEATTGIWALTLAGVYFAFTSLSDFMRQTLRAKEASLLEFRSRLSFLILILPCCLAIWFLHPGLTGTLVLYALPVMGLCLVYLLPLSQVFQSLKPDWSGGWKLLKSERIFLTQAVLYLFLVNAASRLELWILGWSQTTSSVGYYFAASNMVFTGIFFGQALSAHMYPRLHRAGKAGASLLRSLAAHGGLALGLFVAVAWLGKPIFHLIYRRAGFAPGAELLPGLGILLAASVMNYLWLSLAIGKNVQWISSLALVAAMVVKCLLGLQWVKSQGALGMLHASLWAEIPTSLCCGIVVCWIYLRGAPTSNHA